LLFELRSKIQYINRKSLILRKRSTPLTHIYMTDHSPALVHTLLCVVMQVFFKFDKMPTLTYCCLKRRVIILKLMHNMTLCENVPTRIWLQLFSGPMNCKPSMLNMHHILSCMVQQQLLLIVAMLDIMLIIMLNGRKQSCFQYN
jgi:hypothetical protein